MSVKILDFEAKGHAVRLHLGLSELTWWSGPDWSTPKGRTRRVDEKYVCSSLDIAFYFDIALEPAPAEISKAFMRNQGTPMFTAIDGRQQHPVRMGAPISILNHLPCLLLDLSMWRSRG